MPRTNKKKLIHVSDIVFTAVIITVSLVVWFVIGTAAARGTVVVIRRDGQVVETLPLDRDTIVEVSGAYKNMVEIRDGAVRVAYTNCPGHSCERMGAIDTAGFSIVCAPNHVTMTIEGGEAGVDAIAG